MTDERVSMSDGDGVGSTTVTPPPERRRSLLPMLILMLLAFALGVALTVWAWPQVQRRWGTPQVQPVASLPMPGGSMATVQPRPLTADAAQMLDGRVVQLEERLTRITVEAQAASANAARAEGLLVAFAARRALDNGAPLGYIEGQLRLRFGQAQPRAVATIINAAREPVTLEDLRAGLSDIGHALTTPPADAGWWTALEHEARALVTIRKASTPSPRPEAAYDRALRYLAGGRVSAALAEVEHMPGRSVAERWVQMARRYMEARRALDLIETAAILEPRTLRSTEGAPVAQTSPLAP
ncbi:MULTISPECIES: hypothetical protein [unclassified Sphingobium]|uniref:hypothetical protein n=1 Tax=unclassified Sphingobium TaxID=2611147 RepID=UPI000A7EA507|nr:MULTISPECIES: hypothetical protein [unclassified Sphingobium]WIW88356.1 hypothetical protein K3M67_15595 [Sphingobium sp. V4]